MRFFRGIRTMEEAQDRHRELVLLLHPDRNPAPDATAVFQAMQEEYADIPVLLKYISYIAEPQIIYIPVPIPERKTSIWDLIKTVAERIPPEGYAEGARVVVGLFTEQHPLIEPTT